MTSMLALMGPPRFDTGLGSTTEGGRESGGCVKGDAVNSFHAPRMRKSCDFCFQRKKKCDGDGVNPCSFCLARGQPQCVYCERRPHKYRLVKQQQQLVKQQQQQLHQQQQQRIDVKKETEVAGASRDLTNASLFRRQLPTRGFGVETSIKRCRLSPSPATGLVGMKENDFLIDYFRCMGFMPLTCKSVIRQAMVNILFETNPQQQPQQQVESDFSDNRNVTTRNAMMPAPSHAPWSCSSGGGASPDIACTALASRVSTEATKCIFWCAVALGGLVQGRPMQSMEGYIQLATEALDACSGETTEDVARAYTAVAYLNGFAGDLNLFAEYLRKANHIAQDLATRGRGQHMPDEFLALVRHADDAKIVHGHVHTKADLRSFCNRRSVPLEMSGIITDGDVCRYVMQSDRRFAQAIFSDVVGDGGGEDGGINSSGSGTGSQVCRAVDSETAVGTDEGEMDIQELNPHPDEVPLDAGSSRLSSGDTLTNKSAVRRFLREATPQADQLQELANRPEIREGIGGLMINGTLVILKAASDDKEGARECIERCVEVFVRYPGLCRFAMGIHAIHCITSVLASLKARETYGRLAAAYNVVRPTEAPAIPPMEERLGMTNPCDHVFCTAMQSIVESREFGFPPGEEAKGVDCLGGCDSGRVSTAHNAEDRMDVLTGGTDVSAQPASEPVETTVEQVHQMRPRLVLTSDQDYGGYASYVRPQISTLSLPVTSHKEVESDSPGEGFAENSVIFTKGIYSATGTARAAPKERGVEPGLLSASGGTSGGAGARALPSGHNITHGGGSVADRDGPLGDILDLDVGDCVGASSCEGVEEEAFVLSMLGEMESDDGIGSSKGDEVLLAAPDWLDAVDALLAAQTRNEEEGQELL